LRADTTAVRAPLSVAKVCPGQRGTDEGEAAGRATVDTFDVYAGEDTVHERTPRRSIG
jgi:hypothetical protein